MSTIAFLGAGNIARAIMGGLGEDGFRLSNIIAADPSAPCRDQVRALGITATDDNLEAVRAADILMLCVKPDQVGKVLSRIAGQISDKLLISVAAGITTGTIRDILDTPGRANVGTAPVIRCMPNTPALVQTGMTAMFADTSVSNQQRAAAEAILRAVGTTLWVQAEADLDAVTAVSGSGPAYFLLLMEAMIRAGVNEGLSADVSRRLVLQTALGSAKLALAEAEDPAALRRRVTSPGGTTEAAIEAFTQADFDAIVQRAVTAARQRSVDLSGL